MSRYLALLAGAAALVLGLGATPAAAAQGPQSIVEFDRLFANASPFLGAAGAVRGVNAAGLPWAIQDAHGSVNSAGQLFVEVQGLVLANDPSVPANLRGVNPVPSFVAVVSCLTSSGGAVVATNVVSASFPATPTGDAFTAQTLALPQPCVAPVLFVGPSATTYFATTGSAGSGDEVAILRFDRAFGNTSPFLGAAGAIDGVSAAGLPWAISGIFGSVSANGSLVLSVQGLVLANDPSVPAALRNTNPVPAFVAVVSCLTSSGGQVATSNVATASFPADPAGNGFIVTTVALPQPCVAPAVFVGPSATTYFAVTGTA
jgi:hypothetical protein